MTIADHFVLFLYWYRWRAAHRRWFFVRRMKWHEAIAKDARNLRRMHKLEMVAWRNSTAAYARYEREWRRLQS